MNSDVTKGSLVFFCGAGGTGKTVVAEEMENKYGYIRTPSPVRDFYKKEGITSEIDFMKKDEAYRVDFHLELGTYYRKHLRDAINGKQGAFLFERSPLCVLAYTLYHAQSLHLGFLEQEQETVHVFLNDLIDQGWFVSLIFFPYPTPWAINGKDADGFRYVPGVKNYTVHSIMSSLIQDSIPNVAKLNVIGIQDGTPEERANELANDLSFSVQQAAG